MLPCLSLMPHCVSVDGVVNLHDADDDRIALKAVRYQGALQCL